jgi:hypothetical protein
MSNTNRQIVEEDSSEGELQYHSAEEDIIDGDLDGSETSWNWTSRIRLVQLVDQYGKNWGSVLKKMHDEHLISSVVESDKLRIQFNSLNSSKSAFRQPFKNKPFKSPAKDSKTGKKLSAEQKKLLLQEHETSEDQRKQDNRKITDLLDKISNDELKAMKGRGKKRSIAEVNNDIDEAEELRKKVKSQRTENARQLAERQENKERLFITLLEESIGVLKSTNFLIKKLSGDIYPTQPFKGSDQHSQRPTHNNLDIECEEESEESIEY